MPFYFTPFFNIKTMKEGRSRKSLHSTHCVLNLYKKNKEKKNLLTYNNIDEPFRVC